MTNELTLENIRSGAFPSDAHAVGFLLREVEKLQAEVKGLPKARKCMASATSDPPQDCDAPFCGCDPAWSVCIEMLQECNLLVSRPAHEPREQRPAELAWGLESKLPGGDWKVYWCLYSDRDRAEQAAKNGRPEGTEWRVVTYARMPGGASRDADHCDYPDCEQHWTHVVAQARALLEPLADCDPAIRQWLKTPDLPKSQGASRDASSVPMELYSRCTGAPHDCPYIYCHSQLKCARAPATPTNPTDLAATGNNWKPEWPK